MIDAAHAPSLLDSHPPRGAAPVRRLRAVSVRRPLLAPGPGIDVDAVAGAIARRALFTRELAGRLRTEADLASAQPRES